MLSRHSAHRVPCMGGRGTQTAEITADSAFGPLTEGVGYVPASHVGTATDTTRRAGRPVLTLIKNRAFHGLSGAHLDD